MIDTGQSHVIVDRLVWLEETLSSSIIPPLLFGLKWFVLLHGFVNVLVFYCVCTHALQKISIKNLKGEVFTVESEASDKVSLFPILFGSSEFYLIDALSRSQR